MSHHGEEGLAAHLDEEDEIRREFGDLKSFDVGIPMSPVFLTRDLLRTPRIVL